MTGRTICTLVLLPALALSAQGGIIFGKKAPRPNPAERVPQLLATIRTDGDEDRRASAVEELRQYEPQQFPQIVPVLIEALLNDKKPSVRVEAASALGRLRPVSQPVGQALEQAVGQDSSMRVRLQARSSLLQYHLAGYRSGAKKEEPLIQTKEPPLADPPPAQDPAGFQRPALQPTTTTFPSLAPVPAPPPGSPAPFVVPGSAPQPLPQAPSRPIPPGNEGPDLGLPQ